MEKLSGSRARRSAAVAAFLSMAMVAGLALTYFQPFHGDVLFSSDSPHEDAALALELIRAAPHATVNAMLKDLSSSGKSDKAFQMLSSALVSITAAPELAETGKLCPQKDIIISKFYQLLDRLISKYAAHNASDVSSYNKQAEAIQNWLDVESTYRTASDKAVKAKEGATFAEGQYEKWKEALADTKKRQEKALQEDAASQAEDDAERALILELLRLIDVLQTEDSSVNRQTILKQFREKLSELAKKAGSKDGLKLAKIQRLTTTQLVLEAPEADEVKVILRQMLDDLNDADASRAQRAAKTEQEVADAQAKVTEYATNLVTLSNEADKAKQAADSADLHREAAAGAKKSAVQEYTDNHAAWLLAGPRYDRQIAIIRLIISKVQAHCSGDTGAIKTLGCAAGTYGAFGDCAPCPANSYCLGGSTASPCPGLTVSPESSTSEDACTCQPGYYGTVGSCTLCPANSFCAGGSAISSCPDKSVSPAGSTQIADCSCQPGYTGEHATDCALCPKNEICKGGNVVESCPANSRAPEGSSDLSMCQCSAGFHGANGAVCLPCDAGSYCEGGTSVTKCPDNTISSSNSKSITDCVCAAGYYGTGSSCTPCPEGSYCTGGTSINACPPNSISPPGSSQLSQCTCVSGYYGLPNSCVPCPENTICKGGPSTTECPANSASPKGSTDASQCVCKPGYYGSNGEVCSPCAMDSFCVGGAAIQQCPAYFKAPAGSKLFSDCSCPIQSSYTPKGSSSGFPSVEGGPVCERYGQKAVGSACEARTLCEADENCRGFIYTRDPTYTVQNPIGKVTLFKGPANCLGSLSVNTDSDIYLRNNQPPDVWKMKLYQGKSDMTLVPQSASGLTKLGSAVVPIVDLKTVAAFKNIIPGTYETWFVWVFTGTLAIVKPGRYNLCTVSDDGSKLWLNDAQIVDNDGFHPDQRRCGEKDLAAGYYRINAVGFQGGGGAAMQIIYNGPDTGGVDKFMGSAMRRNSDRWSSGDADYLDGDQEPESSAGWKMKTYVAPNDISKIPDNIKGFRRFGVTVVPTVDVKSLTDFKNLVPGTGSSGRFFWVFSGTLTIVTPGKYNMCTTSDDGSKLFIDDGQVVDNDLNHGAQLRCGEKDLAAGQYRVTAVGYDAGGDTSMQVTYKGPDTGGVDKLMPSSLTRNSNKWSNGV